jgi:hypothetical protein
MPYTIDWFADHTLVVLNGEVSYEQLRELGPAHFGDSRFDDIKYTILDFTRADLSQVTLDKPTVLAAIDSTATVYNPRLKLAFAIRDEFQQALCEKYIEDSLGFDSSWTHRIFFSMDEARQWCEKC